MSFTIQTAEIESYIVAQLALPDEDREIKISGVKEEGLEESPKYCIVNYKKDRPSASLSPMAKLCRSVVIETDTNCVISTSATKACPFAEFAEKNSSDNENLQITAFIEGTMVNLFWTGAKWEISTKSNLGGNTRYFKDPVDPKYCTYRTMFFDALGVNEDNFQANAFINQLDKSWTYSFVLQHPDNQRCFNVVDLLSFYRLYLVAVFDHNNNTVVAIPQEVFEEQTPSHPALYYPCYLSTEGQSWEQFKERVEEMRSNHKLIGVSITNFETGERTKIILPDYIVLAEMRGHHPNLLVQYLDIAHVQQRGHDYCAAFPHMARHFQTYFEMVNHYTQAVYENYVAFFCHKKRNIPKAYMSFIHELHNELYMKGLRHRNERMSYMAIRQYVEGVPILDLYKNLMSHHKIIMTIQQ